MKLQSGLGAGLGRGVLLALTMTLVSMGALLGASLAWAEDLPTLVAECESCHGPGGHSTEEDVPSLAGRDSAELLELIEQFYFYERHCPTTTYRHGDKPKTPLNMCSVANTLGKDEKQQLADHFAAQP